MVDGGQQRRVDDDLTKRDVHRYFMRLSTKWHGTDPNTQSLTFSQGLLAVHSAAPTLVAYYNWIVLHHPHSPSVVAKQK